MINTHRKPKRLKVETGLANKIILSMGVELMYCLMILLLKSYPYHFVRTILSIPFCPIPFCPYTILSIPFCPYHFVRYHFVLEPVTGVLFQCLPIYLGALSFMISHRGIHPVMRLDFCQHVMFSLLTLRINM